MNAFQQRNGGFNYSAFVYFLASNMTIGQVITPHAIRESVNFGNTDSSDVAKKKFRVSFDTTLGNMHGFKRKRNSAGGYEYLKVEDIKPPKIYQKLFTDDPNLTISF